MSDIKTYIDNYQDGYVQVTKGVKIVIKDIIEDNFLSMNAKFEVPKFADGADKEWLGDPEMIMSTRLKASTDIDSRNIVVNAENQTAIPLVALLKGALKHKLKVDDFGTILNDVRDELIDMGHVIVKKVGTSTEIVDLRNVIRPPHIMDIQKGGICERTFLTWDEMLLNKNDWKKNWEEVEALKEKMKTEQKHLFIVYEHWTMDNFKVSGKEKFTKGCIKYLDRSLSEPETDQSDTSWNPYLEMDRFATPHKIKVRNKVKLKELIDAGYIDKGGDEEPVYPYEESRFITLKGRWMGAGVREILRPLGKAYRRVMNNKVRFEEISQKGVSVHKKGNSKGKGLTQEAIQALQYGGVVGIKNDESLERLNFGAIVGEVLASADKFMELARMTIGITAQASGQETVASQSATGAAIDQNISKTTFDVIIESQALLWKRYFSKFELKSILEDITLEEWTKIEGSQIELEEMEAPFIKNLINESIPNAVQSGTFQPESSQIPEEEMGRIEEAVKVKRRENGGIRFAQIKKDIIKDADLFLEFNITNESGDKLQKIKDLMALKAEALQNPNSSLSAEKLEEEILDLLDLSAKRFKKTPQELQAQAEAIKQQQMIEAGIPNTNIQQNGL